MEPPTQPTKARATLRRLWRAVAELFQDPAYRGRATGFAALLAVGMLCINGLNVVNSFVGRDFMSAIENKDIQGFIRHALEYLGIFAASTVAAVFFRYAEERLGLLWREALTRRLADAYLSHRTYYHLGAASGIANPDQRISEDVRAFTTTTLSFVLLISNGTLTALSFSGVLWSISPTLFAVAVGYAIAGTLFAVWLGSPLVRLNFVQLDREANFRADLIHVRENAESIALSHREGRFRTRLQHRIDEFVTNYLGIIGINRNLGFFTTGYNYMIQIIPALIVAPLFMQGRVEFGVITQSAMAFATLLGAFSLIVTQFQSISAFTAITSRLAALSDGIEAAHHTRPCDITDTPIESGLELRDLTLTTSDQAHPLVTGLTLSVAPGERWLVRGPEAAPKLALFRALAGLWPCGRGEIRRPDLDRVLFLPERPYLPPVTLRELLLRSGTEQTTPDSRILEALEAVGTRPIVARVGGLDVSANWDDILSLGDQHLLSLARLLLAQPAIAVLDRPGTSLPTDSVKRVLDQLRDRGIACLLFARDHDAPADPWDGILDLHPGGAWSVTRP